jgi:hypothetical protein
LWNGGNSRSKNIKILEMEKLVFNMEPYDTGIEHGIICDPISDESSFKN